MVITELDIKLLNDTKDKQVWDVRDAKAYSEGHLIGAQNKPIDQLTANSLHGIAESEPIYVLCGGGTRAPKAAQLLESFDTKRQYIVLKGGTRVAKAFRANNAYKLIKIN